MPAENSKKINAEMRRYQVIQMKVAGASERAIAEQVGVSRAMVHKDIRRVLTELADTASVAADELRALQMERYNQLLLSWWQLAKNNPEGVRWVLQIMGRIDAINGLIPNRPLISMVDSSQNLNINVADSDGGVTEMLNDPDLRNALNTIAERMESVSGGDSGTMVESELASGTALEYYLQPGQ